MKNTIANRCKQYERSSDQVLTPYMPIILRLDGNSFSKMTKKMEFEKPFDEEFRKGMEEAMKALMEYLGASFAYSQSDEISILLFNRDKPGKLGDRVSKLCSLTASIASNGFNKYFLDTRNEFLSVNFDCRAFNVPERDVNNIFLWRQRDAYKNAVYSYAYYQLQKELGMSKKEVFNLLMKKNVQEKNEIIYQKLGFNFNDLDTKFKRGFSLIRKDVEVSVKELPLESQRFLEGKDFITRRKLVFDYEIPLFDKDTSYIENFLK
tara:strand:- start:12412 stop:13203 length:792 start_codon:yes stop_codon:yes gene_type:complete